MKKVTITDIAKELGISPVTISRALSGQPGVGSKLKGKIIEKANEMGYVKIKKDEPCKVLVLYKKPIAREVSNFSYMVQGIEKALQAAQADYSTEYVDSEAQQKLALPYHCAKGMIFDGAIFVGRFNSDYMNFIGQSINSIISFTGHSNSSDYDSVGFNIHNSGYRQCKYLIQNGHKNIGFALSGNHKNRDRLLGISTAMEDFGICKREDRIATVTEGSYEMLDELFEQGKLPTAFVCDSDFTALELIKALHARGLRVPDDVSVIGSGNSEFSQLSIPSLTTLDLNIEYCCEVVVSTLFKRMERFDKPFESIEIVSRLIERDSVKKM